jgi:mannose-6-phosphate isomerase
MAQLHFTPLAMERVWGGRSLETVFHRPLPDPVSPFGESWEVVDRPEAQSFVSQGPLAGRSLHELWANQRTEIFGAGLENLERFPILVKILDARDDLSIQVHPPAHLADALQGEPKTEMWYIAAAEPGARLVVGLRAGVTRESFAQAIEAGTVAEQVHEIPVKTGDHIFIPSGRLHAIGGGLLIYEIQQNSDTTYRVFDWNRLGLDGKPRELHVEESLASIDYDDIEPSMDVANGAVIASCEHFVVERHECVAGEKIGAIRSDRFSFLHLVEGECRGEGGEIWPAGTTLLLTPGDPGPTMTRPSVVLRSYC